MRQRASKPVELDMFTDYEAVKKEKQIILGLFLKSTLETAQGNGHMKIMATGMHATLVLRSKR